MFRKIINKPKVRICLENRHCVNSQLKPYRVAWRLYLYNEPIKLFNKWTVCDRKRVFCWIRVYFKTNGGYIPLKAGFAVVQEGDEFNSICLPYELEIMSKLGGEIGFHIRRPTSETLTIEKNVQLIVEVKIGHDKIITRRRWIIHDRDKEWELDIEKVD